MLPNATRIRAPINALKSRSFRSNTGSWRTYSRAVTLVGEAVKVGFDLALHSAHVLTGERVVRSGRRYFVTEEGLLLRDTAWMSCPTMKRSRTLLPFNRATNSGGSIEK